MDAKAKYGNPLVVRDTQGDVWARNTRGSYDCLPHGDMVFADWQLDAVDTRYGPLSLPTWPDD